MSLYFMHKQVCIQSLPFIPVHVFGLHGFGYTGLRKIINIKICDVEISYT